jgi:crotonobetainyl-CoA:carnitine CoA-transferase CaiB-like acyl-CoA transferase
MSRDTGRPSHAGPLAGIRVLDLTSVLMGPYCTQVLADLGAEVIKLESPQGDTSRFVGPGRTAGRAGIFANLNRGKRGIVVDLSRAEGQSIALELARRADVVLHSMRLAAIRKLGLDYPAIQAINPQVVYANLYGYGRKGRYAHKSAYDDTIQAMSGMAMLQAKINPAPQYVTTVLGDKVTALSGAYAIAAALFHRQRSGEGQEIEIPMFETMASFLLVEHIAGSIYDPPMGPPVYTRAVTPDRRPYQTRDGYISVLVYNDKQWQRFAALSGHEGIGHDPRFISQAARSSHMAEFCALVAEILAERDTAEWVALLEDAGIPVAPLQSTEDLLSDPHLRDVGFFQEVDDPVDGRLRLTRPPVQFSKTPASFSHAGPLLGEHTAEVLGELGFDAGAIRVLQAQGVIGCAAEPAT